MHEYSSLRPVVLLIAPSRPFIQTEIVFMPKKAYRKKHTTHTHVILFKNISRWNHLGNRFATKKPPFAISPVGQSSGNCEIYEHV
jgi:hypothetical protein